jgi:hypothetical protein
MPNLFEDEVTDRLDLSSEETAMFVYDRGPDESLPYHSRVRRRVAPRD